MHIYTVVVTLEINNGLFFPFLRIKQEARILNVLRHPNVIKCFGVSIMPPAVSIVLEFCKYGSLYDVLYKTKKGGSFVPHKKPARENVLGIETISPLADRLSTSKSAGRLTDVSEQGISENSSELSMLKYAMGLSLKNWEFTSQLITQNEEIGPRIAPSESRNTSNSSESFVLSFSLPKTFSESTQQVADIATEDIFRTDLPSFVLEKLPWVHSISLVGLLSMMADITRGVAHLHAKGYMHCDIKSLNFLVTEVYFYGNVYISDNKLTGLCESCVIGIQSKDS